MKKISLILGIMTILCVALITLTGCEKDSDNTNYSADSTEEQKNEVENNQEITTPESTQEINKQETEAKTEETKQSENDYIKAGDYTLKYGKYVDKYGTVYTLKSDGTYTCESTQELGEQYAKSGTYIVWKYSDYAQEIYDLGEPIGFSGDWILSINPDNSLDSSKPYLLYGYPINSDNVFCNPQTDEVWQYQGN